MVMNPVELVGFCAAFLTTIAFLPQAIKAIRERDTRAISLGMYLIFISGVCFWLVYGLLLQSWPLIMANVVTLVFAGTILLTKLRYG